MGCPQVCGTATLQCSFGAAPAVLNVLPVNRLLTGGMPAANIMDHIPLVNITTFGMCMSLANPTVAAATAAALGVLTPMPCIPATAAPWIPGGAPDPVAGQHAGHRCQQHLDVHLGRGDQDRRAGAGANAHPLIGNLAGIAQGEDNSQACAGSFQRLNHQRTREIGLPSASSGRPSSA